MTEILRVCNIKKRFGGIVAVNDVSLSIKQGNMVGLIGPNGSGKSTLFNVIAGVYPPDEGEVFLKNERITGLPAYEIFKRGLVKTSQIPGLFSNMTVLENFMTPPKNQIGERLFKAFLHSAWSTQEKSLAKEAAVLLDFLKILEQGGNLAKNLSGGQMKLCEIGRGLMGKPTIMLLDEPTAGVAPHLATEILNMLKKIRNEFNVTFFIIEHRLEIFLQYIDYLYVMHLGKIVFEGKPDEVLSSPLVQEIYLGR
ncbi:MAG: ABC transporter ATP-binding protein [Thermoproteota archaeon]